MTASSDDVTTKIKGGACAGWWRVLAIAGPGLVVMLADTDAGSVITAAQSGDGVARRRLFCGARRAI